MLLTLASEDFYLIVNKGSFLIADKKFTFQMSH